MRGVPADIRPRTAGPLADWLLPERAGLLSGARGGCLRGDENTEGQGKAHADNGQVQKLRSLFHIVVVPLYWSGVTVIDYCSGLICTRNMLPENKTRKLYSCLLARVSLVLSAIALILSTKTWSYFGETFDSRMLLSVWSTHPLQCQMEMCCCAMNNSY